MCRLRRGALLALVALLGGCALAPTLPETPPPEGFALLGRVGVRYAGEGFSGGLRWVHEVGRDVLDIMSPLGQTLARVEQTASEARLDDGKRTLTAADAAELTEKALGWPLPLAGMPYWVAGQPRPGAEYVEERDAAARLTHLIQDGWDIRYENYLEGSTRPQRLVFRRGEIEIRLLIDQWAGTKREGGP
jgi:outer membrane lipoprotein LolB